MTTNDSTSCILESHSVIASANPMIPSSSRTYARTLGNSIGWAIAIVMVFATFSSVSAGAQSISPAASLGQQVPAETTLPDPSSVQQPRTIATDQAIEVPSTSGFGASEIAASSSWVQSTGVVDWLGPLAPIAMSPFFGVTCLSGLAIYGPEWTVNNPVLHNAGPLKSPLLFWTFAALTVLTSVPRLTKVSKPFAQAVDKVETYSVILILLLIKFFPATAAPPDAPVAMVQLGIFSFTADTLLAFAMVVNLVVINAVKFFFEFLIWLTPIPLIDAIFEVCNKTAVASLMAVYAFSPTLATIINLILLAVAAIILRWMGRHVRFYRTLALDPLLAAFWPSYGRPARSELMVFPKQKIGPFAPKSYLRLTRHPSTSGAWILSQAAWWAPRREHLIESVQGARFQPGWTMHELELQTDDRQAYLLNFSRRYSGPEVERLLDGMGVRVTQTQVE